MKSHTASFNILKWKLNTYNTVFVSENQSSTLVFRFSLVSTNIAKKSNQITTFR